MRATGSAAVAQRTALVFVDPPLHRLDVGDGGEIQAAAPDERPDRLQEAPAQRQIAGDRARLDHRRAFPVLAHAFVVGDGVADRDRGRRRGRIGPQPQIGAEHVAVGVARLHQPDQTARDPGGESDHGVIGRPLGINRRGGIKQQHEVDIRRVIQLPRSELPHAEDGKSATGSGIVGVGQSQLAGVMRGPQQVRDREAKRGLGQGRQSAGDLFQFPLAADIGQGADQRDLALGLAHRRRDPGPPGRRLRLSQCGHRGGYRGVGTFPEKPCQRASLAFREILNFGAFVAFMGVNAAAFIHEMRNEQQNYFRYIVPFLGFVICGFIWFHLNQSALRLGAVWMVAGITYGAIRTRGFRSQLVTFEVPSDGL